jgi:hypothetical protein
VIVVGMVSCYQEGRLVRGAIESLLEVELNRLYVFEGPAGEPLENEDELPASEFPAYVDGLPFLSRPDVVVHRGRWRTDARKRDEMLKRAQADFPGEVLWAVVVDADEVLVNGRYLRDRLEWILASDARRGASIAIPENPPMARWPLHLVEHDGSMSLITARVFRADLLRSIDHSSSVVTNASGIREGWGNYAASSRLWLEGWLAAVDAGKLIAWPPLPCEPYLVHRSNLRHPGRAGLRMSVQETEEFAKAQEAERHEAMRVELASPKDNG